MSKCPATCGMWGMFAPLRPPVAAYAAPDAKKGHLRPEVRKEIAMPAQCPLCPATIPGDPLRAEDYLAHIVSEHPNADLNAILTDPPAPPRDPLQPACPLCAESLPVTETLTLFNAFLGHYQAEHEPRYLPTGEGRHRRGLPIVDTTKMPPQPAEDAGTEDFYRRRWLSDSARTLLQRTAREVTAEVVLGDDAEALARLDDLLLVASYLRLLVALHAGQPGAFAPTPKRSFATRGW